MKSVVISGIKSEVKSEFKSDLYLWLAASISFSILLVSARIIYTGELTFIFLLWNLFLALVPHFLSNWLQQHISWIKNRLKFITIFITWLLFIPNSFYIITDLFHLGIFNAPIWFDLALLLSFAWNGLLLGILSVRQMEKIIQFHFSSKHELLFLYPIMWLNAFGVYLGRYLRFNSWDVVSNPFALIKDIVDIIFHPIVYKQAWGMIMCYSILMTLIYVTIKKASRLVK